MPLVVDNFKCSHNTQVLQILQQIKRTDSLECFDRTNNRGAELPIMFQQSDFNQVELAFLWETHGMDKQRKYRDVRI